MFTVRHVDPHRNEFLNSYASVQFQPSDPKCAGMGCADAVFLVKQDGASDRYEDGSFFVMNEAGKTVAVYRLQGANLAAPVVPRAADSNGGNQ